MLCCCLYVVFASPYCMHCSFVCCLLHDAVQWSLCCTHYLLPIMQCPLFVHTTYHAPLIYFFLIMHCPLLMLHHSIVGCLLCTAHCLLLIIHCLVACYLVCIAQFLLLIMQRSLFVAHRVILIVCCSSCNAHCLLFIMQCSLFVAHHAMLTVVAHHVILILIMQRSLFAVHHVMLTVCCSSCNTHSHHATLTVCCSSCNVHCLLLIMQRSLFVAHHVTLTVCCSSCNAHCLLLIMQRSLFVAHYLLLIVAIHFCCSSCTFIVLIIARYLLLTTIGCFSCIALAIPLCHQLHTVLLQHSLLL